LLGSLTIGRVFGITIRVHWLFLVMVIAFVALPADPPLSRPFVLLLFIGLSSLVLLHELGHSLVAKSFGIQVVDITFWPLGGMARMSEIPESTRIESLIAIAGPMVNFVLALMALPFARLDLLLVFDTEPYFRGATPTTFTTYFVNQFVTGNLMLGFFNMIPAFPMDGGRVLRALLGWKFDWVRATEIAVRVGRLFAAGMILWGLFGKGGTNLILVLIGVFVWFAGARELLAVKLRHGYSPLAEALGLARDRDTDAAFAANAPQPRPRAPAIPEEASGARRPAEWDGMSPAERLSDDDIERLERYRGRL